MKAAIGKRLARLEAAPGKRGSYHLVFPDNGETEAEALEAHVKANPGTEWMLKLDAKELKNTVLFIEFVDP